jgi:hypothetical protein
VLFSSTEGPAGDGAADDAWWIAEVYAAAVERARAGDQDEAPGDGSTA